MAKVLFGAGTVDQRNKINGWVYSRNRYGSYIRTKVTPVNPQTSFQQNVRQRLGNLSSSWRGLTQAQRSAWKEAAPSFPVIDVFGQSQTLAANVLYIRLNQNLLNIAESTIDTPPLPVAIPDLFAESLTADSATPSLSLEISEDAVPAGFSLAIYATGNVGPGISYVKNRLKYIGTATATTGAVDILSIWQNRFGTMVAGQKIVVRCRLISTTTGQAGIASQAEAIIS